jgi:hypothetical protein
LRYLEGVQVSTLDIAPPAWKERPRDLQDLIDGHAGPGAAVLADMRSAPPYLDSGAIVANRMVQDAAVAAGRAHHAN